MSTPAPAPAFLQGDGEGTLGELDREQVAGDNRDAAIEDAFEEGAACRVQRLGREQGLHDEAGVQRDRVGKQELLVLEREDAAGDGLAPTCGTHRGLPRAVHVARDADLGAESRGGAPQRSLLFLGGLRGSGNHQLS